MPLPRVVQVVMAAAAITLPAALCGAQGASSSPASPIAGAENAAARSTTTEFTGLDDELAAALTAGRAQVSCSGTGRLVSFGTQDGQRRVSISVVAAARSSTVVRDSGSASTDAAARKFESVEVMLTERRLGGAADHAELQPDGTVAVRRSAARQVDGETVRATEMVTYRATDRLAEQVKALARRANGAPCP